MDLIALPALADNYVWLLHDGRQALVVDPGDAAPVQAALCARHLRLATILVTHHHADHVGGLPALLAQPAAAGVAVHGPARERVGVSITPHRAGDAVAFANLVFHVLDVPGHTAGHIAYFAEPPDAPPILFCGDTLFSAGCGRLFEGTPAQMHASLQQLAALPAHTRVCCGHEYTLANLRFAQAVERWNPDVAGALQAAQACRSRGEPTLPSTLARERLLNPFLRCSEPDVAAAARRFDPTAHDAVTTFAALRRWKDTF